MNNKLIIIGASGHGKVAVDIAKKMNMWHEIYFLDDDESIKTCMDIKIIGKTSEALKYKKEADFFVAIGNNCIREKIQEKLVAQGLSIAILIHPDAVIGMNVQVGIGSIIMAGTVINSSTLIGEGCIINTSSSIDHDNIIEDYVHISPGANLAGTVRVGKKSWIGIGTAISNNVNICSGCILGAGSVVIKDIELKDTYVGVPARRIEK